MHRPWFVCAALTVGACGGSTTSVGCTAFTSSDGTIGCCYATYTDGGTVYDTIDYITKDCAPT